MFKYVLKRVLIGFVTLFVLGSATFFLMKATPGSPVNGERFKSKEAQELAIIRYGLDRPVFEQYTMYLNNLAHGDLGESYVKEGVYVDKTIADTFPSRRAWWGRVPVRARRRHHVGYDRGAV